MNSEKEAEKDKPKFKTIMNEIGGPEFVGTWPSVMIHELVIGVTVEWVRVGDMTCAYKGYDQYTGYVMGYEA